MWKRSQGRALVLVFCAAAWGCGSDATTGASHNGDGAGSAASNGAGGAGATVGSGGSTSSTVGSGGSGAATSTGSATGGSVPTGEVRLIAIGDTGEGNTEQHCVADAMAAKCEASGCDAVLMAGDNFYDDGVSSTSDPQWLEKFEQPYDRPGLEGVPFYVVLGNHDYAPSPLNLVTQSDGSKQAQIDYSSLPVGEGAGMRFSDKWTMPAAWYDVPLTSSEGRDGVLHLFGFDSQDGSNNQKDDMQQRISASAAVWKLVFSHHPRFTSGDHNKDNDYVSQLVGFSGDNNMYELQQALYCNTDMFLSGHDHNREFIDKGQDASCPNTHFLISGAGAKVRPSAEPTIANSLYYDESIEGFVYLIANGTSLTIESYDMIPGDCPGAAAAAPTFTKTITK